MSYLGDRPYEESDFPAFQEIRDQFGFLPNFFRAQTLRPDLVDAEANLMGTILIKEGALTRTQKEYLFLVCSASNLSTYCVTAHCEIVRILGIAGPKPEQIALDHPRADIPIADKALLNFAKKLNDTPTKIEQRDIDGLRTYGFSDQQIHEAVAVVGFAKFANFVAFGLGTHPDFEPQLQLSGK